MKPQSSGMSLLDQVTAEALDPAYAQAAAARLAGDGPDRQTSRRWRALVALTMVAAGLLVALTYKKTAEGADDRESIRGALIADIDQESLATDDLVATLAQLQTDVGRARDQALSTSVEGQQTLNQLANEEAGAAALSVTGPGLTVTLGNELPSADDDPIATSTPDQVAQVLDRDLQLLVNSLWAAGAEAISIDERRLGPTTTIRQAGGAILVDLRPVTSPYVVEAIGDPAALNRGFVTSPEATYLVGLQLTYGWQFDFIRSDELSLAGASSAQLRSAHPESD